MKVALINPLNAVRNVIIHPPLGLGYLATILDGQGYDVKIIDMPLLDISRKEMLKCLRKFGPDVVGIYCMTKNYAEVRILAQLIKEETEIPIAVGGPHPTFKAVETLERNNAIDFTLAYEAERSFPELVKEMPKSRADFSAIRGISYRKRGKTKVNGAREPIRNLDGLPIVDRKKFFEMKKYLENDYETTMITTRGCPWKCNFCSTRLMGREVRSRSIENIMPEITEIIGMGFKSIFFCDDTFTYSRKRTSDFCDEVVRERIDFIWTCNARIDTMDCVSIKKMAKAGCYRVFVGLESAAESVLKGARKGISSGVLENVRRKVGEIQSHGIEVHASFALGLPGEDMKTIGQTVSFAKSLKPDMISFNILTPYPGTDLYERPSENGVTMPDPLWYENENWVKRPVAGTVSLPPDKLEEAVKEAYIRYLE